jgi:toxin-antitoxin system PIN domain toxin
MKLIDANVLLYAVNADAREHARAKSWIEATLSDVEPVAFAWVAMLAFLRIATRGGLFAKPLKLPKAFDLLEAWLGARNVQILHPTHDHLAILRILLKPGTNASLVTDAHLAALAIEHGAELVSFDRDFVRFDGLRTSILTV